MTTTQMNEIMAMASNAYEIIIREDGVKHVFTRNSLDEEFNHEEVLLLSFGFGETHQYHGYDMQSR